MKIHVTSVFLSMALAISGTASSEGIDPDKLKEIYSMKNKVIEDSIKKSFPDVDRNQLTITEENQLFQLPSNSSNPTGLEICVKIKTKVCYQVCEDDGTDNLGDPNLTIPNTIPINPLCLRLKNFRENINLRDLARGGLIPRGSMGTPQIPSLGGGIEIPNIPVVIPESCPDVPPLRGLNTVAKQKCRTECVTTEGEACI